MRFLILFAILAAFVCMAAALEADDVVEAEPAAISLDDVDVAPGHENEGLREARQFYGYGRGGYGGYRGYGGYGGYRGYGGYGGYGRGYGGYGGYRRGYGGYGGYRGGFYG